MIIICSSAKLNEWERCILKLDLKKARRRKQVFLQMIKIVEEDDKIRMQKIKKNCA